MDKQREKEKKERKEELDKLKDEKFEKVVEDHGKEIFEKVKKGTEKEQVENYNELGKMEYDGDVKSCLVVALHGSMKKKF